MKRIILTVIVVILTLNLSTNGKVKHLSDKEIYRILAKDWADTVLKKMSLDEKIGQLFMLAAYSNKTLSHKKRIEDLINNYHIGGLIFFKGSPRKQALLTNHYQSISKIPLFIAQDAEWGLSMRLDSVMSFPKHMTLGATQDDSLIYQMGKEIALQCKRIGVNINFAPVVDINNNALNPVIHMRSFGEKKQLVTRKALAYMKGLQDNNVMAVAKHFPGHGDTDVDSHKELPVIKHNRKRLDTLELFPYKTLIQNELMGIMVAHLHMPAYDPKDKIPTTLSYKVVSELLKDQLSFKGLIFTDALSMQAIAKYYDAGEIEIKALKAGNDILLFPLDIKKAFSEIEKAIDSGAITLENLEKKIIKILEFKYLLKLNSYKPVDLKNINQELNSNNARLIKRRLIESALTLVSNKDNLVPIKGLREKRIASLAIGAESNNEFQKTLNLYTEVDNYIVPKYVTNNKFSEVANKLNDYDLIILSIHKLSAYNVRSFGLNNNIISYLRNLKFKEKIILVNFGSPYALKYFNKFRNILQAYESDNDFQDLAAQAIFGGIPIRGRLPVTATLKFDYGRGIMIKEAIRLMYTIPEDVNISSEMLKGIDSLALLAINEKATPGCQILVAKDAKVIYHKSFGYHTYDKLISVQNSDIYDVASLTKIVATILPIMRFYEIGLIKLNDTIGKFIPDISNMDISKIKVKDLMLHQSGLKSWIPFYLKTLTKDGTLDPSYYSNKYTEKFSIKVTNDIYLINSFIDTIWQRIYKTKLKNPGKYKYSDLGFHFLKRIVDSLIHQPFDQYLSTNYYELLGMSLTTFNPLSKFPPGMIVPSEKDDYFRNQIIHGYVHDMAAAMQGGVAGHAGVFSNTNDLAKLMQLLLNNGRYGGEIFMWPSTVKSFTQSHSFENRRGYGFDKPQTNLFKNSPTCRLASAKTFGHTGFTGTCAWADPKYNLIFIFLSNRTYPTTANNKLVEMDIRTNLQELVYLAIMK